MSDDCTRNCSKALEERLKNVFKAALGIDFDKAGASLLDQHLLSMKFRLASRDLLYLLRDIENEFKITIPQKALAEGSFSTFNNILSIISSQLDSKNL